MKHDGNVRCVVEISHPSTPMKKTQKRLHSRGRVTSGLASMIRQRKETGFGQTVHQWNTLNGTAASPMTGVVRVRIVVDTGLLIKVEAGTIFIAIGISLTSVDIVAAMMVSQKYLHLDDVLCTTALCMKTVDILVRAENGTTMSVIRLNHSSANIPTKGHAEIHARATNTRIAIMFVSHVL